MANKRTWEKFNKAQKHVQYSGITLISYWWNRCIFIKIWWAPLYFITGIFSYLMSFIFLFFRFFVVHFFFLGGEGVYKAKIPHFANLSLNHFKIAAIKFNIFLVIKRIYYRLTNYEIQISFIMHRSIYSRTNKNLKGKQIYQKLIQTRVNNYTFLKLNCNLIFQARIYK